MTVHRLVPQLKWMARTPYTACLRPARKLQTTTYSGKVTCKECRRIMKAALADNEHPLFFFFREPEKKWKIHGPEDLWDVVMYYSLETRETMHCIYTDIGQKVLDIRLLSVGSDAQTIVTPAMVYKPALEMGARHVFLCHNHPSGDCWPSKDDLTTTAKLRSAGKLLGLELSDHLVYTGDGYVSMREKFSYMFT